MDGLTYVRPGNGFLPEFPLFAKSEVNGENRIPLYSWVTERCPAPVPLFQDVSRLMYSPLTSSDIRWNFEKILLDQSGQPFRRYPPVTEPLELVPDIEELLAKTSK